jgi:polar amino acid transport system substrate-binding protein
MACAGVIAATGLALTLAAGEPVVFATEAPFAPYTLIGDTGEIEGFEREVADEVCARAHLICEWQNVQFDRLMPGVMSGEFDVILGGFAVTADRMRLVDFTLAYNESTGIDVLYGHDGAPDPASARIAVQAGTIQETHARGLGWDVQPFGTPTAALQAVADGRADLAFGPFETEVEGFADLGNQYTEEVPDMGTAMAVCRGNAPLLSLLNAALQAMIADGTIDELTARWL